MICIPAELKIDDKSVIAQMDRVNNAQHVLENELSDLRHLLMNTQVQEKRDSEEFQKAKVH
ncbi:MAG: hypothetical protein K1W16_05220 [Lachnospiraceae bacterium]